MDDASPAAPLAASAPLVARVLALQRGAGNRATSALLQRELQTRPRDLDPLLGSGGKLKAAVGKSTFAAVRGALVDYRGERRADPDLYKVGEVVPQLSLVSASKALRELLGGAVAGEVLGPKAGTRWRRVKVQGVRQADASESSPVE